MPGSASNEALLKDFNREVFVFRSAALGLQATERVQRANQRIEEQLDRPGPHTVAIKPNPLGVMVQINDAVVFFVTTQDVDVLRQETDLMAAERPAAALREAIAASSESRDLRAVLRALAVSLAATAMAVGLLWGSLRARQAIVGWLVRISQRTSTGSSLSGFGSAGSN